MRHPNKIELEKFVAGKLDAKQLLEMDEHVSGCAECKAAVSNMFASKKAALDLGAMLLGSNDCPEYEQLSAYIDNELDNDEAKAIKAHVNSCEPCTRDVSRMAELRSHAMMRTPVTVAPGMSKRTARTTTPIWKRVLAGAGAVGVVAFSAYTFVTLMKVSNKPASIAKAPSIKREHIAALPEKRTPELKRPVSVAHNPTTPEKPDVVASKPETMLKDGSYAVIKENGKMQIAKADGSGRSALESRIAQSIAQKLKTGKVKMIEPYEVASIGTNVRSGNNINSSEAIAPKPITPAGQVLFSARPVLKWSAVDMAEAYRVTVYDRSGRLLIDETTAKTSYTLPTNLDRGQVYQWRVGARRSETDKWAMSSAAKFAVMSAKGMQTIEDAKNQMPGSHLALGVAYESCGLQSEAQKEYAKVRRANTGSKLAHRLH